MSAVWEPAGAHLVYSYHSYPVRRTLRRHTSGGSARPGGNRSRMRNEMGPRSSRLPARRIPVQHPQGAQGVPPARLALALVRSRPASCRGTGSRAATGRRRRASTRPGRSPRRRARRARRRRGAGTRARAARRSATRSGRRSASTRCSPLRSRSITSPVDRRRKRRRSRRYSCPRRRAAVTCRAAPARPFVLEQRLEHADRGVERRPRRAVLVPRSSSRRRPVARRAAGR